MRVREVREGQRGDYWGARIDPRTALPGFIQSVHTITHSVGARGRQ